MLKYLSIFIICMSLSIPYMNEQAYVRSSVFSIAEKAYTKLRQQGYDSKQLLTIIDFTQPETTKRLFVIDMKSNTVIFSTYVAQGSVNGFSNKPGSHQSSLGAFITLDTRLSGSIKGTVLELKGMDITNSKAYSRNILVHGANYVGSNKHGRSWGCFAVPVQDNIHLINLIKQGTVIYAYGN